MHAAMYDTVPKVGGLWPLFKIDFRGSLWDPSPPAEGSGRAGAPQNKEGGLWGSSPPGAGRNFLSLALYIASCLSPPILPIANNEISELFIKSIINELINFH